MLKLIETQNARIADLEKELKNEQEAHQKTKYELTAAQSEVADTKKCFEDLSQHNMQMVMRQIDKEIQLTTRASELEKLLEKQIELAAQAQAQLAKATLDMDERLKKAWFMERILAQELRESRGHSQELNDDLARARASLASIREFYQTRLDQKDIEQDLTNQQLRESQDEVEELKAQIERMKVDAEAQEKSAKLAEAGFSSTIQGLSDRVVRLQAQNIRTEALKGTVQRDCEAKTKALEEELASLKV